MRACVKNRSCHLTANGLPVEAVYNADAVDYLFLPLLRRLTGLCRNSDHRIAAFIAAPPGAGKTTLSLFLEAFSRETPGTTPVQALGIDGFHYHNDYLASHFVERNGRKISMAAVKGAPETFDVEKLEEKLSLARREQVSWPIYDRRIHESVDDAVEIRGEILLLEGNYLLLKDQRWEKLRKFCEWSVMIRADESLLEKRLIDRKKAGGFSEKEARAFYKTSDLLNIRRVLTDSYGADEVWRLNGNGEFLRQK